MKGLEKAVARAVALEARLSGNASRKRETAGLLKGRTGGPS
jgi:hypothetical protein